jgi:hypothetical protein
VGGVREEGLGTRLLGYCRIADSCYSPSCQDAYRKFLTAEEPEQGRIFQVREFGLPVLRSRGKGKGFIAHTGFVPLDNHSSSCSNHYDMLTLHILLTLGLDAHTFPLRVLPENTSICFQVHFHHYNQHLSIFSS